jgi:hypothetical protein
MTSTFTILLWGFLIGKPTGIYIASYLRNPISTRASDLKQ